MRGDHSAGQDARLYGRQDARRYVVAVTRFTQAAGQPRASLAEAGGLGMLDIICARPRTDRLNVGNGRAREPLQQRRCLTSRNQQREHSSRREFGGGTRAQP